MALPIQLRRDTAANLNSPSNTINNPLSSGFFKQGEFAYELDTNRAKVGNGIDRYIDRPYLCQGGAENPLYKNANFTAAHNDYIFADTSVAGFTITLPPVPTFGDKVIIRDYENTFGTNNLVVARNGELINGSATNLTINRDGVKVELRYSGLARGWLCNHCNPCSVGDFNNDFNNDFF